MTGAELNELRAAVLALGEEVLRQGEQIAAVAKNLSEAIAMVETLMHTINALKPASAAKRVDGT